MKSSMTVAHVREKVDECSFFLSLMRENAKDVVRFGRFMSAFLCSFGSAFQRLEHCIGKSRVMRLLGDDRDWNLLYKLRHDEVHGEGAIYYRTPTIRRSPAEWKPSRFTSRWLAEKGTRLHLTWDSENLTYQFRDKPGDLIQVCFESLSRIEKYLGTLDVRAGQSVMG
jgi:hypothetical protein